jgi:hypothetical protein
MRVSKVIALICALSVLSSVAFLFVAGCGFRVSASDFPVLKLANETGSKTTQSAPTVIRTSTKATRTSPESGN